MTYTLRTLFALSTVAMLYGCQSYPETPARVVSVNGNYSPISDCVYVAIERQGAWRKEDLPSMQRTRLLRGDDKYALAKVEFHQREQNTVDVSMWFSPTIKGENFYPNMIETEVKRCAQI